MKNTINSLLVCFFIFTCYSPQAFSQSKYGKITMDEMKMTSYAQDSTASAVILSKTGKTAFIFNELQGFMYEYTLEVKVKILKDEGLQYCTQEIFYTEVKNTEKEEIKGLSGTTYNLEDGKIIKTKLSKEFIFEEEHDENLKLRKFTMPAAKVGSVVEFKFTKVSPYDYSLPDFVFQADIPIEYTSFEIEIPEYYDYNLESQGYEALANKTEPTNMRFHIQYSDDNGRRQIFTDNCTATKRTFTGKNIPALKVEPYIWTTKDYITKISFELRSFQVKFGKLHQRSSSWAKIDNQLLDSKYFGGNTKKESLFKNDVTVGDITPANASTILSMVRSKAKWNKKNSRYPSDLGKVLKEGLGNSADLNFLLINALKAAKFDAYPVLLSTRDNGRIPFTHASIIGFNYVITGVKIDDKTYLVDAASQYSFWNILPQKVMVEKARIIKKDASGWIDLTQMSNGTEYHQCQYKFTDGECEGNISATHRGNAAYAFRDDYFNNHKDKNDYIENVSKSLTFPVENFEIEGDQNISADIKLSYTTKPNISLGDEYLYINPIMIRHFSENPFKAESRKFPINFGYMSNYIQVAIIEIPDGYAAEELPQSEKFLFGENNDIALTYKTELSGNNIKIHYQYQLKTLFVSQFEYENLRDFFAKVALKNSEQIVLKKIN